MRDLFDSTAPIRFLFPLDGDYVNERDGQLTAEGIILTVSVAAPKGHDVYIGGVKADYADEAYRASFTMSGNHATLIAEDKTADTACQAEVRRLPLAMGKYRLSSDDNILFLQNIHKNKEVFTSIFDDPYLAMYKQAHDLYGACVHLNLFYEFKPEESYFSDKSREYFNLSMMTDKFKDEFRANAHWLKLAFHAQSDMPAKPYQYASAQTVRQDCLQVMREIARFAGTECMTDTTTVHWGEATREGVCALRQLGLRSLTGYFEKTKQGEPLVAYYTDGELCDHIGGRDFWFDRETDMLFGRIDLVLNLKTLDWVKENLRAVVADPHRSGFVSIMIHEQYFYPDYCTYLPDFAERVLSSCQYLQQQGYCGAHISTVTKEA